MNAQLQSESLKLRTLRTTWIIAAAAVILSSLYGVAVVRFSITAPPADGQSFTMSQIALSPVEALWLFAVGAAILATAGEFQHRTIRTTLLINPRRPQVLIAKALVSGGYGAALVAVGAMAAVSAAVVTSAVSGVTIPAVGAAGWGMVGAGIGMGFLWAVLATGLGILTRSTAIAITAVLLWRFVGEGVLPVLTRHPDAVARWTPLGASKALLGAPNLLPMWGAAVLFAGYAIAVCATAAVLFVRRDPS